MEIDVWLVAPDRPAMQKALREVLGDIPIHVAPDGRPYTDADVSFSVSHTSTVGAIAVARDSVVPVGIDVEAPCSEERAARVARGFPAEEARALAGLQGEALRERFLRHWTAKEAVAKAGGLPLLTAVREVVLDADGAALLRPEGWTLHLISLTPGREALAVAAPVRDARIRAVASCG